jgi:hypothetical protein
MTVQWTHTRMLVVFLASDDPRTSWSFQRRDTLPRDTHRPRRGEVSRSRQTVHTQAPRQDDTLRVLRQALAHPGARDGSRRLAHVRNTLAPTSPTVFDTPRASSLCCERPSSDRSVGLIFIRKSSRNTKTQTHLNLYKRETHKRNTS